MGFASFHQVHKVQHKDHKHEKRATPNPSCFTGGFYTSPTNGATIDSLVPLEVSWDTTCLDTELVDIHLLAPGATQITTEVTVWKNVPLGDGKKALDLKPRWWNSTSAISLQLSIVPAGSLPALTELPAGPVITATYTAPTDGPVPEAADTTKNNTNDPAAATESKLSPGKTAAAVILPLLFVALLIFAYFKFQRRRAAQKTQRFSVAVDKRMSTISTDWKSMSAAGANAAIRNSIAVNRDSSAFAFGAIRPVSTASAFEGNAAGVGVAQMTQVKTGTGVGLRNPNPAAFAAERASRISRVSFADTARPSGETRRTRAFHSAYMPPLPTQRTDVLSTATALSVYPDSELESNLNEKERTSEEKATLSPRQAQGPLTLTSDDIRARIQGRSSPPTNEQSEYDEVMPALSMMRTGSLKGSQESTGSAQNQNQDQDDYLFNTLPIPPTPIHPKSGSPVSPFAPSYTGATYAPTTASSFASTPTSPLTTTTPVAMSPDEMLRAYAVRKAANASPAPSTPKKGSRKMSLLGRNTKENATGKTGLDKVAISHPMPAASASNGGYGMAGVGAGAGAGLGLVGATYAIGEDEEDGDAYGGVYIGTAN